MGKRLDRVREGKIEYERLKLRVTELESLVTKITPVLSDMPKGGSRKKDDTWAMLIDYKDRCQEKLDAYIRDCVELEEEIEELDVNARTKTAMRYRYIDCLNLDVIAECMHYDVRNVSFLLSKGKRVYHEKYRQ